MSSRETILKAITANKPAATPLPVIDSSSIIRYEDLCNQFATVLASIGGATIKLKNLQELKQEIDDNTANGNRVVNRIEALNNTAHDIANLSAEALASVDIAYLQGSVAVAENGCVWLYESQMGNRLLPFICQHLVLVIREQDIVATMHDAYNIIDTAKEGFGVFLAGPSKTADIEQSLVIGAHGARSLVVYILES